MAVTFPADLVCRIKTHAELRRSAASDYDVNITIVLSQCIVDAIFLLPDLLIDLLSLDDDKH
jgi:hypothetical protein